MNEIQHKTGSFFVEREGKRVAELTYRMDGATAIVDHTFVDPAFRGGSLARDLVDAVVEWARAEKRKVVPTCPYVRGVFAKTPEYADVRLAL